MTDTYGGLVPAVKPVLPPMSNEELVWPVSYINKVLHRDCITAMKGIPDKAVDLVLTDPPYLNANMAYDTFKDSSDVTKLVLQFLEEARRISKIVIFPSGKYETELELFRIAPPRWRLCWFKGASSNISPVGFNDWEMMMVYGDKICVNQHDHFHIRNDEKMGNYGHPCPKPLGWARWIIEKFCPEKGIVLDPFVGSGTVVQAAKELNRSYIGMDISWNYCEKARERAQNALPNIVVDKDARKQQIGRKTLKKGYLV